MQSWPVRRRIIVVDKAENKAETVLGLGATDFVPAGEGAIDAIKASPAGAGPTTRWRQSARRRCRRLCLAAARPGGTIVLAGLSPMGSSTNLPGALDHAAGEDGQGQLLWQRTPGSATFRSWRRSI